MTKNIQEWEKIRNIIDVFLSKVGEPVTQEKIEWEGDFRSSIKNALEEILLSQRKEIREMIEEAMPKEKEQLDKNDPDNYGACYAISGFNDCRAQFKRNLEKILLESLNL